MALSGGRESKDAANACMAACVMVADHLAMYALVAAVRVAAGKFWARVWASCRKKVVASWLHRPPTSMANTTRRQRLEVRISGYARSLFLRASCRAAAAYHPPRRRGLPSLVSGATNVVSTAIWLPL